LIPKIPTEIFSGIGIGNTKKYRPIPTEKYRFGIQLYTFQCFESVLLQNTYVFCHTPTNSFLLYLHLVFLVFL
jgi:hypothetical protein